MNLWIKERAVLQGWLPIRGTSPGRLRSPRHVSRRYWQVRCPGDEIIFQRRTAGSRIHIDTNICMCSAVCTVYLWGSSVAAVGSLGRIPQRGSSSPAPPRTDETRERVARAWLYGIEKGADAERPKARMDRRVAGRSRGKEAACSRDKYTQYGSGRSVT